MIQRTILFDVLQYSDWMPTGREHMADGGPWLILLGGGCTLVVEIDARWMRTMEGKRGIPLSFTFQNQTKSIYFSVYAGSANTLMSSPHAHTCRNNM